MSLDSVTGARSVSAALATQPVQALAEEFVLGLAEADTALVPESDAGDAGLATVSVKPVFSPATTVPLPGNLSITALELEALDGVSVISTFEARVAGQLIKVDAGGKDRIYIKFNGESLVQIEDASEQQIYREVRSAGDTLQIIGTAPFNVLLGDASVAELQLNGSEIDFSSSIRIDKSARLTIGL